MFGFFFDVGAVYRAWVLGLFGEEEMFCFRISTFLFMVEREELSFIAWRTEEDLGVNFLQKELIRSYFESRPSKRSNLSKISY